MRGTTGATSLEEAQKPSSRRSASGAAIMIKAVAGGGGRGMRVVHRAESSRRPMRDASPKRAAAFGMATSMSSS